METTVAEFGPLLRGVGPALFFYRESEENRILLLLRSKAGVLHLIGPDLGIHRCPAEWVRAALCSGFEASIADEIDQLIEIAGIPEDRRKAVRSAMLRERLGKQRLGGCWVLRLPPTTGFWQQLLYAAVTPKSLADAGCIRSGLWLGSSWMGCDRPGRSGWTTRRRVADGVGLAGLVANSVAIAGALAKFHFCARYGTNSETTPLGRRAGDGSGVGQASGSRTVAGARHRITGVGVASPEQRLDRVDRLRRAGIRGLDPGFRRRRPIPFVTAAWLAGHYGLVELALFQAAEAL